MSDVFINNRATSRYRYDPVYSFTLQEDPEHQIYDVRNRYMRYNPYVYTRYFRARSSSVENEDYVHTESEDSEVYNSESSSEVDYPSGYDSESLSLSSSTEYENSETDCDSEIEIIEDDISTNNILHIIDDT